MMAVLLVLSVLGKFAYALTVRDSLVFFATVAVVFYAPGALLTSFVHNRLSGPVTRAVLALSVGVVAFPIVYKVLRELGLDFRLLVAIVVVQVLAWIYLRVRRPGSEVATGTVSRGDTAGLIVLVLVILALLHWSHFGDVRFSGDGFATNTSQLTESVFHLGIVNSLQDTYPPLALYASGSDDFSYYHLNMHLQIELVARITGIDTLRLVSFYFPLLYFTLLAALPFVFVRSIGGSVVLATVAGMLVFGSDFSFVPGLLLGHEGATWAQYFPTTVWSLFTLNGYIPATLALFTCLLLLRSYLDRGGVLLLAIFAVCVVGAFGFKASMGLQIAALTLGTGVLWLFADRHDPRGHGLLVTGGLLTVLLLVLSVGVASGTGAIVIEFAPLSLAKLTLQRLGMNSPDIVWYPVLLLLFLAGGLGVRALGVWAAARHLREPAPER